MIEILNDEQKARNKNTVTRVKLEVGLYLDMLLMIRL